MAFYECSGGTNLKSLTLDDLKSETTTVLGRNKTYTCTTLSRIYFVSITTCVSQATTASSPATTTVKLNYDFGGNTIGWTISSTGATAYPSAKFQATLYGI